MKLIPRKKVVKTKTQLESEIQRKVVEYAKLAGWRCRKRSTLGRFGTNGEPDYEFMCYPGYMFLIEFKAPGEEPSVLQWERINELRALNFGVYIVDNVEVGKGIVNIETSEHKAGLRMRHT